MDAATEARLIRLFGEPVCQHPVSIGPSATPAQLQFEVRLQNGRAVTVCRLCWQVVTPRVRVDA